MKRNFNIISQISYLFLGKILYSGAQVLLPILFAWLLSPELFGIFALFIFWGNLIGRLFEFGFVAGLYYFLPNAGDLKNIYLSNTILILICTSILFTITYLLVIFVLIKFNYSLVLIAYWQPLLVYIVFFIMSFGFEDLLVIEEKSNLVLSLLGLESFTRLFLPILMYILYENILSLLWSLAIIYVLKTIVFIYYVSSNYRVNIFNNFKYFKQQWNYSHPIGSARILSQISSHFDDLIISSFFKPVDFAIYSAGKFRIPIINILYPAISNVIVPKIAIYAKESKIKEAKKLWHKIISTFAIVTIPFVIYFEIVAEKLFAVIFPPDYSSSVKIFRVILLTFFVQILARGTILNAFAETKYFPRIEFIGLILGIICSVVFVPKLGPNGAAISFVIVYFFSGLYQLIISKKILKSKLIDLLPYRVIGKILLICVVSAIITFLLNYFSINNIEYLILSFTLYIVIILVCYSVFNIVKFKDIVNQIIKKYK